jgi:hypothetical protein
MKDEQIKALWLRVTGFDADGDAADIIGFARALLADGGKGEAVAEVGEDAVFFLKKRPDGSRWPRGTKLYTAPQAECAPREAQPVAISDDHAHAIYKLAHQTGFVGWLNEFRKSLAAPTPERADADTAGVRPGGNGYPDAMVIKSDPCACCGGCGCFACLKNNRASERADAEKDAALTDDEISRVAVAYYADGSHDNFLIGFARAILAAKEKKS